MSRKNSSKKSFLLIFSLLLISVVLVAPAVSAKDINLGILTIDDSSFAGQIINFLQNLVAGGITGKVINPVDCPSGMIAYYSFDNSSNVAKDDYGTHDGTADGGVSSVGGRGGAGQALNFDGINDKITVSYTNWDFEGGYKDFSTGFWAIPGCAKRAMPLSKGAWREDGFFWYMDSTMYFFLNNAGDRQYRNIVRTPGYCDGNWHFFFQTRENKVVTTYVDGTPLYADAFYINVLAATRPLYIGYGEFNQPDVRREYYKGQIDEVAIFNRALSASEIADLYNGGNGKSYCAAPPVADADNDGIPDAVDNCPAVYNPDQLNSDGVVSTNLALGKTTSSSGDYPGLGPSGAVDGNYLTFWEADSPDWPSWISVDLGAAKTIGEVRISWLGAHAYPGTYRYPIEYYIEASNDNFASDVREVVHVTGNSNVMVNNSFNPVSARYVRLRGITGNSAWHQVEEFEIYGAQEGVGDACDNCKYVANPDQLDSNSNCPVPPYTTDPLCGDACEIILCGNNVVEAGEECDDGNVINGDGCSATCTTEVPEPVCNPPLQGLQLREMASTLTSVMEYSKNSDGSLKIYSTEDSRGGALAFFVADREWLNDKKIHFKYKYSTNYMDSRYFDVKVYDGNYNRTWDCFPNLDSVPWPIFGSGLLSSNNYYITGGGGSIQTDSTGVLDLTNSTQDEVSVFFHYWDGGVGWFSLDLYEINITTSADEQVMFYDLTPTSQTVTMEKTGTENDYGIYGNPEEPVCPAPVVPGCGNGIKDAGEECDDGNTVSGDGCSATCTIEARSCNDGTVVGGTITTDGNYCVHTFTTSGTLTFAQPTNVSVLVVAGGGGGGGGGAWTGGGGGGGAGGLIYNAAYSASGNIPVTVGAGAPQRTTRTNGYNGQNSVFGTLTAIGGGGGGAPERSGIGQNGGSGGGAAQITNANGLGTAGQGNNGGISPGAANHNSASGGGGAGAVGGNTVQDVGGAGGAGLAYAISGSNIYYAGGGGGGNYMIGTTVAPGGIGGGGAGGGTNLAVTAVAGTNGLGGGGGGANGASTGNYNGAAGGSGIVIVRYSLGEVAAPCVSAKITPTGYGCQPNRGECNLFVDGNTGTCSYITPSFTTQKPSYWMIAFLSAQTSKFRFYDGLFYDPAYSWTLNVAWTNDATPIVNGGNWYPVSGMQNGNETGGEKIIDPDFVLYSNGTMINYNMSTAGWRSLTFNPVTATGIRVAFSNTKDQYNHMYICEAEAYTYCAAPPPAVCGNGIKDAGEECDDGNTLSGDGCSATCMIELPICGRSYTQGMVGYWKGDNDAADFYDGNDGTVYGGATYAAGKVGNAFSFGGINGFVDLGNHTALQITKNLTISVWANLAQDKSYGMFVAKEDKINNGLTYIPVYALDYGDWKARFYINGGAGGIIYGTTNLQPNTWYNIVGVYNAAGTLDIYVNGIKDATQVTGASALPTAITHTYIGARVYYTANPSYFKGKIDEVAIFNKALSANEINSLYQKGVAEKGYCQAPVCGDGVKEGTEQCDDGNTNNGDGCSATCVSECPDGMISYWKGEYDATDFYDSNNGVLMNGAYLIAGKIGNAFRFDGTNDYIDIADNNNLDFGTGSFTVEAWVYSIPPTSGIRRVILNKGYTEFGGCWGPQTGFVLYKDYTNEKAAFTVENGPLHLNVRVIGTTNIDNGWHHLVAVRNSSTSKLYLYVDGAQQASADINPSWSVSNTLPLEIGVGHSPCSPYAYYGYFNGKIDEVAVFNRALSADEIQQHYNSENGKDYCAAAPVVCGDGIIETGEQCDNGSLNNKNSACKIDCTLNVCGDGAVYTGVEQCDDNNTVGWDGCSATCTIEIPVCGQSYTQGMISYWNGENNADDYVGIYNGALMNGATYAAGKVGDAAFSFDGVNDYIATTFNPTSLGTSGPFTISFWFYDNGDSQYSLIGPATTAPRFYFMLTGGAWYYGLGETYRNPVLGTTVNRWNHIVLQYTGTNATVYQDNVEKLNTAVTPGAYHDSYMGISDPTAYGSLNGRIDEFAIWNRALSRDEITAVYNSGLDGKGYCVALCGDGVKAGKEECDDGNTVSGDGCSATCVSECPDGMIGYWKFDETSGTTAVDSIAGNNGNIIGPTPSSDSISGGSFYFDGADTGVQIPNQQYVNLPNNSTLSLWFKATTLTPTFQDIIATCCSGWTLYLYPDTLMFYNGGSGNILNWPTTSVLSANTWYNVMITRADNNWVLYVNGASVSTASGQTAAATSGVLSIGKRIGTGGNFNGYIDEVAIFNKALSANEINSLYQKGVVGNGYCALGPVCGDGNVDAGEECDDGNTVSGDGCSACEIDMPPITTAALTGSLGEDNWWTTNVDVTLTATDDAGVAATYYCTDSVACSPTTLYDSPFTITSENYNYIRYSSTDIGGNIEAVKTEIIKIDKTASLLDIIIKGIEGLNNWFVSNVIFSINASDDVSGISKTAYRIDGGSWR